MTPSNLYSVIAGASLVAGGTALSTFVKESFEVVRRGLLTLFGPTMSGPARPWMMAVAGVGTIAVGVPMFGLGLTGFFVWSESIEEPR